MIKKVFGMLCLLFLPVSAFANNWYVDPAAGGGANSGTNWANAWTSFSAINWGAVNPGDTIYLSGGSTSQTYTTPLNIGKSGTAGSPITVAAGQDSGHTGKVIIDGGSGSNIMLNIGGYQYITINGNYSGNRNIVIQNNTLAADAPLVYGSGNGASSESTGIHLTYIEVANSGTGIRQNYSMGSEIDHVFVHNIACEAGIALNGSLSNYGAGDYSQSNLYDQGWLVHDSTIQVNNQGANNGVGPDAIQGTSGLSIYNNQIYGATGTTNCSQHQDGVQKGGEYYKIYNNTMYCLSNSDVQEESGATVAGFLRIYNNVFEQCSQQSYSHGIEIGPNSPTGRFTDFRVMNNTFVDFTNFVAIRFFDATGGTLTTVDNIVFQNNIIYNSGPYNVQFSTQFCGSGIIIDSNNVNAGPQGSAVGTCNGSTYNDTNRKTAAPAFVTYSPYAVSTNNLHLASSSTVDNGVGINLVSFFTTDKDGNLRLIPWSLGAYNFGTGSQPAPPTNVSASVQ